jgi:hypothetical protein
MSPSLVATPLRTVHNDQSLRTHFTPALRRSAEAILAGLICLGRPLRRQIERKPRVNPQKFNSLLPCLLGQITAQLGMVNYQICAGGEVTRIAGEVQNGATPTQASWARAA